MQDLKKLAQLVKYNILTSTTAAGSGHPTSSLSATELLTVLFFGGYLYYDLENPHYLFNDRVIFSKGHASPLLYALYAAAGVISHEELLTLRKFGSKLEGHPTPELRYVDVATGSLGQGLSVGLGMAMALKKKIEISQAKIEREPKVFVLLGDSEMAEGQVWEALELAGHYKVNNLIGIIDVNRLGQRGETMLGWDAQAYEKRVASFGWRTIVLEDGHNIEQIQQAFATATVSTTAPVMIIAKTKKGHGISFLENQDNWHGKAVPKDKLDSALKEIGPVEITLKGEIVKPKKITLPSEVRVEQPIEPTYIVNDIYATREAYGDVLAALAEKNPDVIALDAEVSNSTYAERLKKVTPGQFFEMYIAEQNMVSTALGFSKIGFIPFISSFAAFFTRAFDQIRMSQYSNGNLKIVGSHAGVSIGSDGSSQMALEDLSMMQSILKSIVLYPSDAISTFKLIEEMAITKGIAYMRTTREKTPIIYGIDESFPIGGSKVLHSSQNDIATVIAAGITLHEALKAYKRLHEDGINIAIIDLYSVKPIDKNTINEYAKKTKHIIVVEDHYPSGGIGEAVKYALSEKNALFHHLAVTKIPHSGTPEELLHYEEIDAEAIINKVKEIKGNV